MNLFKLLGLILVLITSALCEEQDPLSTPQGNKQISIFEIIIGVIGFILIIIEAIIWNRDRKKILFLPSELFTTSEKIEQSPSSTQLPKVPQKQALIEQQLSGGDQIMSPAIQKIAEQNQNAQNKKKRRRKTDKLSDRRSKGEQASFENQD